MAIIFFIIETVFMELKIIDKSFPNGIESTLLQHFFLIAASNLLAIMGATVAGNWAKAAHYIW